MTAASEVIGAVLTGGESRRMGSDKARLELDGESLGARAARVLGSQIEEVVVVSRALGDHADLGVKEIADRIPGRGPLGGVHAALEYAAGRPVFALACDLPRVGPEVVAHLLELALPALTGAAGPLAVVPALDGRPQPLCAVYAAAGLPEIEKRLAEGDLRMLDLAAALGALRVDLGKELPFYRPDLFANLNDPGAAARLGVGSVTSR